VGGGSERRRSWRTQISFECTLSRKTGKVIEAKTLDIGPGGMRVHTNRPQAYRVYAVRFERLGDEARAEIASLAAAATPPAPAR
jgi:hypothetical protein